MQDILEQVISYFKGIWNKRWYMMFITWLLCLIGWSIVYIIPNQYESKAKIYIDTQSLLRPLLKGLAVENNIQQQINLMVRTLLTRPNVEKIIRLSDLDLNVNSDDEFDELVDDLKSDIMFKQRGRLNKNIYDLSYKTTSPEVAQVVLQSVITVFIENSIGESKEETVSARNFLSRQIKEYEKRLLASENRLKDFKQKNMGMLPSTLGQDYYGRMDEAKKALNSAKLNLKETQKRKISIDKELVSIINTLKSSSLGVKIVTSYDERIEKLNMQLDTYLLDYTEQHPDVLSLRRLLNGLEKDRKEELDIMTGSSATEASSLELNPVYQELKIQLSTTNAEIESLIARVSEYTKRYDDLKRLVHTIPEIEAQLTALNRDYEITKSKYEEFLERKESASISESVDQTTESVQFKVIETPRVENKPVGPKRIMLTSIVLVGGLLSGLGFAFLLSQIKPIVMNASQLETIPRITVLGSVSAVVSPIQRRRRILLVVSYLSLLLVLFILYALLIGWYMYSNKMFLFF